jgi:hypothetical protein
MKNKNLKLPGDMSNQNLIKFLKATLWKSVNNLRKYIYATEYYINSEVKFE